MGKLGTSRRMKRPHHQADKPCRSSEPLWLLLGLRAGWVSRHSSSGYPALLSSWGAGEPLLGGFPTDLRNKTIHKLCLDLRNELMSWREVQDGTKPHLTPQF